ncbi:MAG: NtaA/DmoA family FMN-dependent monooxygenase, partial [Salinisphaera sp.]|nr:NtaA/DmoA family FMN-dependent monooxygenase [Salinisphaera sp.]
GLEDMTDHDQRYDRADEYMQVVYKLWEHSWEEGAIVCDREADIHTDAAKVHEINHQGKYFDVPGPHMCEPSPQRTPVLFQAGASGRGKEFAAAQAEAVFGPSQTIADSEAGTRGYRELLAAKGRAPEDIKLIQGLAVIVAPTDEEARLKAETCRHYANVEGVLALVSGWLGTDLSTLDPSKPLEESDNNAIRGLTKVFQQIDPDRVWTVEEIGKATSIGSIFPKLIGSPTTVADEMEGWMEEGGVDGFNIHPVTFPTGFEDFVNMVVPELQRRGRFRTAYESDTLRESFFGPGRKRLPATHPAHRALPPWRQ